MGASVVSGKTDVWGPILAYKITNALSLKAFVAKMTVNLMCFHNENFSCHNLRMHLYSTASFIL